MNEAWEVRMVTKLPNYQLHRHDLHRFLLVFKSSANNKHKHKIPTFTDIQLTFINKSIFTPSFLQKKILRLIKSPKLTSPQKLNLILNIGHKNQSQSTSATQEIVLPQSRQLELSVCIFRGQTNMWEDIFGVIRLPPQLLQEIFPQTLGSRWLSALGTPWCSIH